MEWLQRALVAGDGTASVKALEQLANTRVRVAWEQVVQTRDQLDELLPRSSAGAQRATARAASTFEVTSAEEALSRAIKRARDELPPAMVLLNQLTAIHPTVERRCMLGSAYKRMAQVEGLEGNVEAEKLAIEAMHRHYLEAETLARDTGAPNLFYPAMNRMVAELVIKADQPDWSGFDPRALAGAQQSLQRRVRDEPDFWSIVSSTELRMYAAVAQGGLAPLLGQIEIEYADLFARTSAARSWRSVYDQAAFVLAKYAARATREERQAANAVLALLARFARAGRAPTHTRNAERDVFISFAAADHESAEKLAGLLAERGLTPLSSRANGHAKALVESHPGWLEEARACVMLVSKATENPSGALAQEWTAILNNTWTSPNPLLFAIRLEPDAVAPTFLPAAVTADLSDAGDDFAEIAGRIAAALLGTDAANASSSPPAPVLSAERKEM
jgi:hypothetical protein